MTDKNFQTLLNRLAIANSNYKILLEAAENELTKRFGKNPSDIDNDSWIDKFHVGSGSMTVKEAEESMVFSGAVKQGRKRL